MLLIPQEYIIQQRIRAAVIEERDRCLTISNNTRQELLEFIDKLQQLNNALQRVFYAALWAKRPQLVETLKNPDMVETLTGKLMALEYTARHIPMELNNPDADIRGMVGQTLAGIEKVLDAGEDGAYLREIGKAYFAGDYDQIVARVEKISKGGQPEKGWRMILAEYVEQCKQSPDKPTYGQILGGLLRKHPTLEGLSDEWQYIIQEIRKPKKNQQRLNWLKQIMKDYRENQKVK